MMFIWNVCFCVGIAPEKPHWGVDFEFSSGFLCNSFVESETRKAFISPNNEVNKPEFCFGMCYSWKMKQKVVKKKTSNNVALLKQKPYSKNQ